MYIPMELICFLLGFISSPILIYVLWELVLKKDEQDEEDKG